MHYNKNQHTTKAKTAIGPEEWKVMERTRSEEEVDELIEALRGNGVKIIKAPQKASWEVVIAIFQTWMEIYGKLHLIHILGLTSREM